jgi:pectin methylesterase-like acyl-CoA thioesterase
MKEPRVPQGAFASDMTDLSPNTQYYVRAYATNAAGTSYGNAVNFETKFASIFYVNTDGTCDGKTPCYETIQSAVDAATDGATVWIAQGDYNESIMLNASKSLTLEGGWNSTYDDQISNSTFMRSPVVQQGRLTFRMVSMLAAIP